MKGGRYMFPAAEPLLTTAAATYSEACQAALDAFDWTNMTTTGSGVHD